MGRYDDAVRKMKTSELLRAYTNLDALFEFVGADDQDLTGEVAARIREATPAIAEEIDRRVPISSAAAEIADDLRCNGCGALPSAAAEQRLTALEHELAKADRRTAEQERIIASYRTANRMLADVVGEHPGSASEMVGCVEVKLRALRDALTEALELYDEKPGHSEWGGCLCPSNGWGHAQDCHLKRIAELRKLAAAPVKCRACDDTRSTSCGAEDCPIPLQLAGNLSHRQAETDAVVRLFAVAAERFAGATVDYRRFCDGGPARLATHRTGVALGSSWPGPYRAQLYANKNQRSAYRIERYGETAEDAAKAVLNEVARLDARESGKVRP